ncbi:hypothetical protein ACA910_010098 [Epithemia clementina (nom. ined.)]
MGKIVRLLLERGAHATAIGFMRPPQMLLCAARRNHAEIVALLLDIGQVPLDEQDDVKNTALHLTASLGHVETAQLLLNRAKKRMMEMLDHQQSFIDLPNRADYTPLLAACQRYTHDGEEGMAQKTQIAMSLIEAGANIEASCMDGTPLMFASWAGQDNLVRMLLDRGARVHDDNGIPLVSDGYSGMSALHGAAGVGVANVCQMLLDAGASVRFATTYEHGPWPAGRNALHQACEHGQANPLSILIHHLLNKETLPMDEDGSTPDSAIMVDRAGDTPLHVAAYRFSGNHDVLEVLLSKITTTARDQQSEKGYTFPFAPTWAGIRNHKGETPLHLYLAQLFMHINNGGFFRPKMQLWEANLHIGLGLLLPPYPEALHLADHNGYLPGCDSKRGHANEFRELVERVAILVIQEHKEATSGTTTAIRKGVLFKTWRFLETFFFLISVDKSVFWNCSGGTGRVEIFICGTRLKLDQQSRRIDQVQMFITMCISTCQNKY